MPKPRASWLPLLRIFSGALIAFWLAACSENLPAETTPQVVRIYITATPPAPTGTSSPTPTPSQTPTPTATAQPISARGNPRAFDLFGPTPAAGAYCGYVDTLDFPLNPPDGLGVRGGGDFGIYRSRYEKYHAGEDWGFRGESAFGTPVYAIGHGTVTYADGLGWGPDQGVVIIRHYFPDGSYVLSFYGHLDPPSVTLVPGQCVERGDPVGNIGRPRTSPHLHFEIRTHLPYVPGPGYLGEDPTTAGWLSPSAFIWQYRMRRLPGVVWTNPDLEVEDLLGPLGNETFLVRADRSLMGLYTPGGGLRWVHELASGLTRTVFAPESGLIYTSATGGRVEALRLPGADDPPSESGYLVSAWQIDLPGSGLFDLAPLPGGGLAVFSTDSVTAFSPGGTFAWTLPFEGVLVDWQLAGAELLVTIGGEDAGLWVLSAEGRLWSVGGLSGQIALAQEGIYVFGAAGLDLVSADGASIRQVLDLAPSSRSGTIVALPRGGVMLFHADIFDRRLMLFQDGALVWERSVKTLQGGVMRLIVVEDEVYFAVENGTVESEGILLYRIDLEAAALQLIFEGGTRAVRTNTLRLSEMADGVLLIQFGDGEVVAFDPAVGE